ncbi:MAG: DUF839 domain-containing protein, partial [Verrucomicrobiales bacterium]|nr:DUF839 domain-containing protein [Verrucomicrobiales bacterium]
GGEPGYVDGPGTAARFHNPDGIAVDAAGFVYLTDRENHAVRRLSPSGMVETVLGTGRLGPGLGSLGTAQLSFPSGLGVTAEGVLFVTDTGNLRVLRLTPSAGAPTIVAQPQDTFATLGTLTKLSVQAEGSGELQYQWYQADAPIPGRTSANLILGPLTPDHEGSYSVLVRDARGETRSRTAVLTVVTTTGPTILRQPEGVAVLPGDPVTFAVEAEGHGTLEYQWLINGFEQTGEVRPSLVIPRANQDYVGTYAVRIRDAVGSVTSQTVTLRLLPVDPPVILVPPTNQVVRLGTPVVLTVSARGTGPLLYEWFHRIPTISRPHYFPRQEVPDLDLGPARAELAGTYGVTVYDLARQFAVATEARLVLVPAEGPYILTQPPALQFPSYASDLTLSVEAGGADRIFYQWFRAGIPIEGATLPTLPFHRLTPADDGGYTVQIRDSEGRSVTSEQVILRVLLPEVPQFLTSPSNLVVHPGDSATFTAEVISSQSMTLQWLKDGVPIPLAFHPTLTLPAISATHLGHYSLKADVGWIAVTSAVARLDFGTQIHLHDPLLQVSRASGDPAPGDVVGPAAEARFNAPAGLAVDSQGRVYLADTDNHRIKCLKPDGQVLPIAGTGVPGFRDGPASEAQFQHPAGLALLTDGTLLIADQQNHLVRQLGPQATTSIAAGAPTPGHVDGPRDVARFDQPTAFAVAGDGSVFLVEAGSHAIRRFTPEGNVETYAGSWNPGYADGPRLEARFSAPSGIAIDAEGNVYVTESRGHRVRRISTSGQVVTMAGTPEGIPGFIDGQGTNAWFHSPQAITLDAAGNLIIADTGNHALRHLTPAGTVTTLAGTGVAGSHDGLANTATFNAPAAIAVAPEGAIYVADTGNHLLRRIARPAPVRLDVQRHGLTLTLSWPAGRLLSAPSAHGPWTEVPDASSPQAIQISETQQYFQIRP